MPWRTTCSAGVPPMAAPLKLIVPAEGAVRPAMARRVVDLPAPLEPISETMAPSGTDSDTPLRARIGP